MHKYKIIKLDRRHKGNGVFDYFIDFLAARQLPIDKRNEDFVTIRNWCWESWGPSQELDWVGWDTGTRWAWWREPGRASIYFNEPELAAYLLQWE